MRGTPGMIKHSDYSTLFSTATASCYAGYDSISIHEQLNAV